MKDFCVILANLVACKITQITLQCYEILLFKDYCFIKLARICDFNAKS
ncbi:hypothetical protein [Helicobacter sp. 23-1046]